MSVRQQSETTVTTSYFTLQTKNPTIHHQSQYGYERAEDSILCSPQSVTFHDLRFPSPSAYSTVDKPGSPKSKTDWFTIHAFLFIRSYPKAPFSQSLQPVTGTQLATEWQNQTKKISASSLLPSPPPPPPLLPLLIPLVFLSPCKIKT